MRIVAWAVTLFLVYMIVHVPVQGFEWLNHVVCILGTGLLHHIADENLLEEIKKVK